MLISVFRAGKRHTHTHARNWSMCVCVVYSFISHIQSWQPHFHYVNFGSVSKDLFSSVKVLIDFSFLILFAYGFFYVEVCMWNLFEHFCFQISHPFRSTFLSPFLLKILLFFHSSSFHNFYIFSDTVFLSVSFPYLQSILLALIFHRLCSFSTILKFHRFLSVSKGLFTVFLKFSILFPPYSALSRLSGSLSSFPIFFNFSILFVPLLIFSDNFFSILLLYLHAIVPLRCLVPSPIYNHLHPITTIMCLFSFFCLRHIQITELLSTGVVFHLANVENAVTNRKVLCIVGIAFLHIVASGFDQFIANVFKGEGLLHQVRWHLRALCSIVSLYLFFLSNAMKCK